MSGSQIPAAEAAAKAKIPAAKAAGKAQKFPNSSKRDRAPSRLVDDDDPEPLLRRQEVADLLGVTVRMIERLVEAGQLLLVYVGPLSPRIPRSSYDQFVAKCVKDAMKARAA
jgi:excisionase family DNA binding protein